MANGRIFVGSDSASVGSSCLQALTAAANEAIGRKGFFVVAVSGGSIPSILAGAFKSIAAHGASDLSKWRIVLADERCVPLDHADSNYLAWETHIFSALRSGDGSVIPEGNILRIAYTEDPADVCADYEHRLRQWLRKGNDEGHEGDAEGTEAEAEEGAIDVVLLGMGPDGHTASLFPHHPLYTSMLTESATSFPSPLVAYLTDSPKPPPTRITLTLSAINNSKQIMFVATGAAKSPILEQFISPTATPQPSIDGTDVYDCTITALHELPASVVQCTNGSAVLWFVDRDAASFLRK